jgi:hypothetical protein
MHLGLIVIAILIGVYVSHESQEKVEESLLTLVNEKSAHLAELALITDRNGADEIAERIIADCTRREEYESYLIRLGSLSKQELVTMQNLFENCGSFYAERKALMVSRLAHEYESYAEYVALLAELRDVTVQKSNQEIFSEIVTLETERSTLLTEQAVIQEDIITHLISGKTAQSIEVTTLVQEAQQIAELLTVQDKRVDVLRASLTL